MKKLLYAFILLSIVSCNTVDSNTTGKLLTENIPSVDKFILEGDAPNAVAFKTDATPKEYNLIERLYDTVWYQTEKEFDDGVLEIETEFVIFDDKSWIVEREMENGVMEAVEDDDFAELEYLEDVTIPTSPPEESRNAVIVRNTSKDDGETEVEYEGYYLLEKNTLFIVEADTQNRAKILLTAIIANPALAEFTDTEKYLLSTKLAK